MKKLALAAAAALALTIAAPVFTGVAATPAEAQTTVKKKVIIKHGHSDRGHMRKKVVIKSGHHDRGRHMGWRHHNVSKKVIIKKRGGEHGGKTVIKKKIEG